MGKTSETSTKIEELSRLESGWYFGDGLAPSKVSIQSALRLNAIGAEFGLVNSEVFPRVGGGIQLNLYRLNRMLEVKINSSGICDLYLEIDDALLFEKEDVSFFEVIDQIKYWGSQWLSSGSYTEIITARSWEGSPARPSRGATGESQSSARNASRKAKPQYAITYGNTTLKSAGYRTSTASFLTTKYQLAAQ